jgi:hypothetical protein
MANLTNSNLLFGALWAIADTLVILGGGFRVYLNITKKLDRIEYAIFNDGNGMKQQVEDLHDNQAIIKTDIEVMKARMEMETPKRRSKAS